MAGLVGKDVTIFWDDNGRIVPKEGNVLSEGLIFIEIKTHRGLEAIPTSKIIRVEVRDGI